MPSLVIFLLPRDGKLNLSIFKVSTAASDCSSWSWWTSGAKHRRSARPQDSLPGPCPNSLIQTVPRDRPDKSKHENCSLSCSLGWGVSLRCLVIDRKNLLSICIGMLCPATRHVVRCFLMLVFICVSCWRLQAACVFFFRCVCGHFNACRREPDECVLSASA